MSLFELSLIAALAVYRLSMMLNAQDQEPGPGHVFDHLRRLLGVRYDEKRKPSASNIVAEILLCYFCLSVWIGIGVTVLIAIALHFNRIEIATLVLLPFAFSGAASFMRKWAG